jgi:hypothetical protein
MAGRDLMKNFHLPLPEQTYDELRAEAERAQLPATTIARGAISDWLKARKRIERRKAVMEYAAAMAGTRFDLDPALESAGIEELMKNGRGD